MTFDFYQKQQGSCSQYGASTRPSNRFISIGICPTRLPALLALISNFFSCSYFTYKFENSPSILSEFPIINPAKKKKVMINAAMPLPRSPNTSTSIQRLFRKRLTFQADVRHTQIIGGALPKFKNSYHSVTRKRKIGNHQCEVCGLYHYIFRDKTYMNHSLQNSTVH